VGDSADDMGWLALCRAVATLSNRHMITFSYAIATDQTGRVSSCYGCGFYNTGSTPVTVAGTELPAGESVSALPVEFAAPYADIEFDASGGELKIVASGGVVTLD